jgi:hypothetical protein
LGVSAELNNILPVQALESGAFQNLGTVISVAANAPYNTPVLRARLVDSNKNESTIEVKQGYLEAFALGPGESAALTLQPLNRADVGFGPGRGQSLTVNGGALGVVIDARGRPLRFTEDPVRRRELMKKWLWTLGG